MAGFSMETPGVTSDPRKNNTYLRELVDTLRYVLQNIDEDNFGEDLYARLSNIELRLDTIEEYLSEEKE